MNKTITALLLAVVLGLTACAALQQAYDDKKLSDATPVAPGEVSPAEKAATVSKIAGLLGAAGGAPFGVSAVSGPTAATAAGFLATWIFGWRRGRKLRLAQPSNPNPITGSIGAKIGLEGLVQHIADLRAGIFDVGNPEGMFRRLWKGALTVGTAFLASHGDSGLAAILTPILLSLEKGLQKVEPLTKPV